MDEIKENVMQQIIAILKEEFADGRDTEISAVSLGMAGPSHEGQTFTGILGLIRN